MKTKNSDNKYFKAVVVVANGTAERFGQNKLNVDLLGKSVLQHCVDAFCGIVDQVVIVSDNADYAVQFPNALVVAGGTSRTQSVKHGLLAVDRRCHLVAVHDGARPYVKRELIQRLFDHAEKFSSAIPCLPMTDTVCRTEGAYADRSTLKTVQTPQIFHFQQLLEAYNDLPNNQTFTDDGQVFLRKHGHLHLVEGEPANKKITYQADIPQFAVGNGFDVHQLIEGDGVILGGVKIPFDKKLLGHSDADVLTHAIMDALLSASANKDIGNQFPDSNPAYKNANSMELLKKVVELISQSHFEIVNISAVIIAQQPKLSPHIDQIAQALADALNIPKTSVNLTATTTENLGIVGEGKAIASNAACLLKR